MPRVLLVLLLVASVGACKQDEGEVCQIDDDCEQGLDCNASTGRCQRIGGDLPDAGGSDTGITIDATSADASVADASLDAATPVDAAGEPDAILPVVMPPPPQTRPTPPRAERVQ